MHELLPVQNPVLVFAIVALLILLAPMVMARWRLPGAMGLLLAGAVLGPNALGVLARDQSFVLFGTVGLLYIMFIAALEIDRAVLKRYRSHSIAFGLLTFAIPQGLGTLVAHYLLGFGWPAAILLASMFASHTLLAYPIASRLGIARNEAVTTAVGGTIVTDTLALLVLAVIAGSTRGTVDEAFWYRLGLSLTAFVTVVMIGLPWLARRFFRHVGRDGVAEFVFVLAAVFGCASLAQVAGSEPIVGAFLAGLALNRLIPHNSTLMNRLQFTGEAIFIPFFLLSVGMLLDVHVFFAGPRAWTIAIGMVVAVLVTKWLAAEATRLVLGYDRDQARVIFGLSVAQAAATLAATIVGYEIGLFDDAVVNGAILMILVTCLVAPWMVDRHGRRLALASDREGDEETRAQQRVIVALSDRTPGEPLLELAQLVRDPQQAQPIFPLAVIEDGVGAAEQVSAAERRLARAVAHLSAADVPAQPLTRIDLNLSAGILRARRELRATEVILGWSERTTTHEFLFGSVVDNMLADAGYTLIVSRNRKPLQTCSRVLFAIPPNADHEPGFPIGVAIVTRLARQLAAPMLILTEREDEARIRKCMAAFKPQADVRAVSLQRWSGLIRAIGENGREDDMLVLYGTRPGGLAWRPAMKRLPARLATYFTASNMLLIYPAEPRALQASGVAIGVRPSPLAPDFLSGRAG